MIAVIGDLHGCFYTLLDLIEKVRLKYPGIDIYSVGDLIDRGNFSFEVIEFIKNEKIPFTPGNHDYMFYYSINFPNSVMGNSWLFNGYENTLESYTNRAEKIKEHLNFIFNAPLFFNLGDCFISHAGISNYYKSFRFSKLLNNEDLLSEVLKKDIEANHSIIWARGELLNIGKLQVVGHTRRTEIVFNKTSNTVYIDTSAYAGNKLSAVIVNNNSIIDSISVPTHLEDIE